MQVRSPDGAQVGDDVCDNSVADAGCTLFPLPCVISITWPNVICIPHALLKLSAARFNTLRGVSTLTTCRGADHCVAVSA
jgi:hypothetical protein